MNTKKSFWIFSFVAIGVVLMLMSSCKKDDTGNNTPGDKNGIVFNSQLTYGSVTDVDGYTYKTIKIGTQTLMAENLRVEYYYDLDAYYQYLMGAGDNNVGYGTGSKNNGMSVRCVKD